MAEKTPFYNIHKNLNAKIIDFGGFEMPVQYSGIRDEHNAVREHAGIFDVSHMGEFIVDGEGAEAFLQKMTVNDVSKLVPGRAQYTVMCYDNGGIVDDLIIYMIHEHRYMLVVNASNRQKDYDWLQSHCPTGVILTNKSDDYCLLAVQGPQSVELLQTLTPVNLSEIKFYHFAISEFAGYHDIILSATGYTGEKGFEIYFDKNKVDPTTVWKRITDAGQAYNLKPAGLGARDTLRLEMGYALYGNDISKDTNPLEAGLGWITKLDKDDFIGKDRLLKVKENGPDRKLVGLITDDERAIPRSHYDITDEGGATIGEVTSGGLSITTGKGIAMGYVVIDFSKPDSQVFITIRGKSHSTTVVKPPFIHKK